MDSAANQFTHHFVTLGLPRIVAHLQRKGVPITLQECIMLFVPNAPIRITSTIHGNGAGTSVRKDPGHCGAMNNSGQR